MRKVTQLVMAAVLLAGVSAFGYEPPSDDQVRAVLDDPALIKELIRDASSEEAVDALLRVVREIEQADMESEVKRERVGEIFAYVQEELGDQAALVLSDTARRMNPELLPSVAAPGATVAASDLPIALPLAPPIAPRYEGQ